MNKSAVIAMLYPAMSLESPGPLAAAVAPEVCRSGASRGAADAVTMAGADWKAPEVTTDSRRDESGTVRTVAVTGYAPVPDASSGSVHVSVDPDVSIAPAPSRHEAVELGSQRMPAGSA
ncbi:MULTISPECIES: hypothetical protein [unclassified Microbacterium]|uniref:hypothetical protein n=1 Tax=unclassified Microbacterium TaxID=2609290 RepID=UPI001443F0AC|nr:MULTISPECIES: hypothetical protein [unclassified Microbacterium]